MALPTPLFAGATLAGASSPYTIQRSSSLNVASDVADPAGSGATVIRMQTDEAGGDGDVVRIQALSPNILTNGTEYWQIARVYIDPNLPTNGQWLTLMSTYGSPYDSSGPLSFRIKGNRIAWDTSKFFQPAYHEVWSTPLVKGKWIALAFHVRLDRSSAGFTAVYYSADADNSPLVNQTNLNPGDTSRQQVVVVGGETRLRFPTMDGSIVNGPCHCKILNYHKDNQSGWSGKYSVYFGKHRVYPGSATITDLNAEYAVAGGGPPPPPSRDPLTDLDDGFTNLDAWTESSGSPSVASGRAVLPPGSEIKMPPTYDVGGFRFVAEDLQPAARSNPADTFLLSRRRVTLVPGADNTGFLTFAERERGDGSVYFEIRLGVNDTGLVTAEAPAGTFPDMALGITADYAQAVGYVRETGGEWQEVISREITGAGFDTLPAKVAVAGDFQPAGLVTSASVDRVYGEPITTSGGGGAGAVRVHDGTDDRIKIANPPDLIGAWSILLGFRRLSEATSQFLLTIENEAGTGKQLAIGMWDEGGGLRLEYNTSMGNASQTIATAAPRVADGDVLYLITHPGTVDGAPTVHMFKAGAWSSVAGSSMGVRTSIATRKLVLGDYLGNLDWHGHIFVAGIWTRELTTVERDGIDGADAAALLALTPARLYEPGRDPVQDLTGSGNDQETVAGTTIDTTNLPASSIYVLGAGGATIDPPSITNLTNPTTDASFDEANPVFAWDYAGDPPDMLYRWRLVTLPPDAPEQAGTWTDLTSDPPAETVAAGANLTAGQGYRFELEAQNSAGGPFLYIRQWDISADAPPPGRPRFEFQPPALERRINRNGITKFYVDLVPVGEGDASFRIVETADYLTVTPETGVAPARLELAFNADLMEPGETYRPDFYVEYA